jgi:hypothetical protein
MVKYNLKHWFVVNKWRMQLGYATVGLLGIAFLVADALQRRLLEIGISIPLIFYGIFGVIALWLVGYGMEKSGMYSHESEYTTQLNPYFENWKNEKRGGKKQKSSK